MEKDCLSSFYSWETEAVSTLWYAEPASEGVEHTHDLPSALLAGSSGTLCIKGIHAVHPCLRSMLPVWMWPWFASCVCPDHKNKRLLHDWDADLIEALEPSWSLVLNTVSGSKETGKVQARHSDLSCAVSGWRYLEIQSILNSLFEAWECLSQYLKPQMSESHPHNKH